MKTIRTITRGLLITCLTLFLGIFAWANWEEPPLSAKLNLKPINLVVFKLSQSPSASDSAALNERLAHTNGVTACTVNPSGMAVSVTYYDDQVSEQTLQTLVQQADQGASKINFAAYDGPKCPVPAEYINFLVSLKTTLCFR
ncbi:MAG: hypothetical protein U0Y10_05170 [Spirosomataceae bacterium]